MSSQRETLDDPVFGRLDWDGYEWVGRLRMPALAVCRIRWQLTPDEKGLVPAPGAVPGDGQAAFVVDDEAGGGPDDAQRAAYRFLVQNHELVAANVLVGLVRGARYFSSYAGGPEQPHVERLGLMTVEGIRELVVLSSINFLKQARDSESYVTFEFGCCWDHEHGISILTHHGQFIANSVGSDFYGRATTENLEAHAKGCRERLERSEKAGT